jgi:hypothetical protein
MDATRMRVFVRAGDEAPPPVEGGWGDCIPEHSSKVLLWQRVAAARIDAWCAFQFL